MNHAVEKRALYNLLRMNWLSDPTLAIEPWQVEDYRSFSLSTLFERLAQLHIQLDRHSFTVYAEECDSPEEFTDHLVADRQLKPHIEDQIYLLIFELWRRLVSEKPSLSILCNELDEQIYAYDHGQLSDPLLLHDILHQFVEALNENVDAGIEPTHAFELLSTYCAHDIAEFLYDFITEQIEMGNENYAQELLDQFDAYLGHNKWFKLLRIRLFGNIHSKIAQKLMGQLLEEHLSEQDFNFNLEFLSLIAEIGESSTFKQVLHQTMPLIATEEDFQDLLNLCLDYFHRFDQENSEKTLQRLLKQRSHRALELSFDPNDADKQALLRLFNL